MWCDCLLADWIPFFSRCIALSLSWYFCHTLMPSCSKKFMVEIVCPRQLLAPTVSDLVVLVVFSFCPIKGAWSTPFPIEMMFPVCDLKSSWTPKAMSTHVSIKVELSILLGSGMSIVCFKYEWHLLQWLWRPFLLRMPLESWCLVPLFLLSTGAFVPLSVVICALVPVVAPTGFTVKIFLFAWLLATVLILLQNCPWSLGCGPVP